MYKFLNKIQKIGLIGQVVLLLIAFALTLIEENYNSCVWIIALIIFTFEMYWILNQRNENMEKVYDALDLAKQGTDLASEINDDRKKVVNDKYKLLGFKLAVERVLDAEELGETLYPKISDEAERIWERINMTGDVSNDALDELKNKIDDVNKA